MKKLFLILITVFPLYCTAQYNQYEYLRINNVNSWNSQQGSIDSVMFEVKPKGVYTEIGMYFDFSTNGTSFSPFDSLEVEMLFKLPPNAEVIDMWLWIDDTIIVADVYDKWTASQIYEDIVDRRTDPAILYRYDNHSGWDWWYYEYFDYTDYYMFKIFPLLTSLPRKAKITYLIRNTEAFSKYPSVALPHNILALSNQSILNTCVRFFPETGMMAPKLNEMPASIFTLHTNPISGNYYETNLSNTNFSNPLTLSYTRSIINLFDVANYTDTQYSENFYQLQVKPGDLFNINENKKALFLFDFIPGNCYSVTSNQLLAQVKSDILSRFSASDSVNFMFSGFITNSYSNSWIPADSASITNAFNSINSSWFNSYSNLLTLLADGIQFIQTHNDIGSIVLIASSGSNGAFQQANAIINNLMSVMGSSNIPIHVVDMNETNSPVYYISDQYYYGNEYLYLNLSTQTTGEHYSIKDESLDNIMADVTGKLSGFFSNFDMYVTLENGYTYSNFDMFAQSGLIYFDQPAQKIGKYNGTGRFRLIAHGQLPNGQLYVKDTLIDNSFVRPADSVMRAMWAAQLIRELASQSQTNTIISQIITISMNERVLSDYTAFLALEPGLGPLDPDNNTEPVGNQETNSDETCNFSVYPNPFDDVSSISYSLVSPSHVLIAVYDVMGKLLTVLADTDQEAGDFSIVFNPDDLAPGIYFCRLEINHNETRTVKMVKK